MNKPTLKEEKKLWKKYKYVIGLDEVGRGAFAGPVVVGAVVFDKSILKYENLLLEINDSKLLTPKKRFELSKKIKKYCFSYSFGKIGVSTINRLGIGKATQMAFRKAIKYILIKLSSDNIQKRNFILVDGFHIRYMKGIGLKNQKAIIKGDRKCVSIAAASIIAKVYRDKIMTNLNRKYSKFGFLDNKGYGTRKHINAIKLYGLSDYHRKSFNLSKYINK